MNGQALPVALVVLGDDLLFQDPVDLGAVRQVLGLPVGVLLSLADGPAGAGVIALAPPAVENAEIQPPFMTTFMPLVPLASWGRSGLLSHTSTPWTTVRAMCMS